MDGLDMDQEVIVMYLDYAELHKDAHNSWGEGYWMGRSVEHVNQNAVDRGWFARECLVRSLDTELVAYLKAGGQKAEAN